MKRLRSKLTYANVMATIAVFIALGGASYAAIKLPKNSVGSKQLKKNAVTDAKVKNEAITAAKIKKGTLTGTQINASTIGTVPNAGFANSAGSAQSAAVASSLTPPEAWHELGAAGEPVFLNTWRNSAGSAETVAFYKDHEGIVHLRGQAEKGDPTKPDVFTLPPGYRPASGKILTMGTDCLGSFNCEGGRGVLDIYGSGFSEPAGSVLAPIESTQVSFENISFRAES